MLLINTSKYMEKCLLFLMPLSKIVVLRPQITQNVSVNPIDYTDGNLGYKFYVSVKRH